MARILEVLSDSAKTPLLSPFRADQPKPSLRLQGSTNYTMVSVRRSPNQRPNDERQDYPGLIEANQRRPQSLQSQPLIPHSDFYSMCLPRTLR
jgi:hypothetical protein